MAERFNRTLKELIYKYMTAYNTPKYLEALPELVQRYNTRIHSSTQMAPADVTPDVSWILQLNSNLSVPFGQLPIVKRFMKGIFELHPALPRYKSIWDVSIVFNYFRKRPSASDLNLKELTLKLTFLLSLLSGQRCQAIKSLTIDNRELSSKKCIFKVTDKVKQTRVGTHRTPCLFVLPRG